MPAPPLSNSFEGGTNGSDVTVANSGGGSGDAFNVVALGASCTKNYSRAQARGGLSMAITEPGTGASTYASWTGFGTLTTVVYFSMDCFFTAVPSVSTHVVRVGNAAATASAYIRISSLGIIQGYNAAAAAMAASLGTIAIATGQWSRLEWRIISSTTVGELEWRYYSAADSTAITETKNATGQVLAADTDGVRLGAASTPVWTSQTHYFDNFRVATANWIGPSPGANATYPYQQPAFQSGP